jgi:branched-chain amino acid transport system permease protein
MQLPGLGTLEIGIVSGIGLGCAYALVALAYNLVLASSGVFNLGQGGLISGGTILTVVFGETLGLSLPLTLILVVAIGAVAGSLSELVAVRAFLGARGEIAEETLVSTLGLGLVLTAVAALLFGGDVHAVKSYAPLSPVFLGNVPIQPIYIVMLGVVIVVAGGIELVLRYTGIGLVTRAIIADPEGSSLLGISVIRVVQVSFIISGALAALAAYLIAPVTSASVYVGDSVALYGFAALAIGGFGSFRGAVLGGLIVGLGSVMAQVILAPDWSRPVIFLLLIVTLVLRPAGLFGRAGMFGARASREV